MQLGFVIDHARCIGCHACTVACKSENGVPVGSFRTWVKYTERGEFPEVRRSFAVLRCNQCTSAPCVTICPTSALQKRADGIVDVDPSWCIGCKSCMQACPYDALYIHPEEGTAEKCHFCAHRTEQGLAPACAVVCPTEAIIPGDFDDPGSRVFRLKADNGLVARKTEAGTGPNVYYREAEPAGLRPLDTNAASGWLWANQLEGAQLEADAFALSSAAEDVSRTVYDVQKQPMWGRKVTAYLFAKSLAAGLLLAAAPWLPPFSLGGSAPQAFQVCVWGGALAALMITTFFLVADLKRPARFLHILRRPNWSSWLARGAVVLMAYGALLTLGLVFASLGRRPPGILAGSVLGASVFLALPAAGYTAFLFAQAKGRVLWMRRGLALHLVVQAVLGGGAALLLGAPLGLSVGIVAGLRWLVLGALVVHAVLTLRAAHEAPTGRTVEYARALRLITHGPYASRHWVVGVAVGIAIPLLGLLVVVHPISLALSGLLVLVGLWAEEDLFVEAGQALPIS